MATAPAVQISDSAAPWNNYSSSTAASAPAQQRRPRCRLASLTAARDALILEHLDWARSIALHVARRLPAWWTADDLTGPAELALVEAAGRYDPRRHVPFRAYGYQRIHGACVDYIRRGESQERAHEPSVDTMAGVDDPERAAYVGELTQLWQAVYCLPQHHKFVIQRHYGDGDGVRQIAAEAHVHISQVNLWLEEAREMLRVMCRRLA